MILSFKHEPKGVIEVFIDEEHWGKIHASIFGKFPKFQAASLEEFESAFQEIEYRKAYPFALKQLTLKSMCSYELDKALSKKCVTKETREKILETCMRAGYLNDERFAESYIQSCQRQKLSMKAITFKMRNKGFSDLEVKKALSNSFSTESEKESILRLLETRYKSRDLSQPKVRNKVIGALMRKGFATRHVFELLKPQHHP